MPVHNPQGYFQPSAGYSPDLVLVAAIEAELDEIDFTPHPDNNGAQRKATLPTTLLYASEYKSPLPDETEEPDTVLTDADLVGPLQDVMEKLGIPGTSGQMHIPQETVEMRRKEDYEANCALIEAFETLDDVDTVYHNMKEPSWA